VNVNGTPVVGRKTSKRESRLRFEALNAFVDSGMADLSRAELVVWLILYRDTKRDRTARASLDDLARRGGINRQTASRAVGRLARRRMLQVLRRGGLNHGPSTYRVFPYPMERTSDCLRRRLQHCRHFTTDTVGAHAYHPRSTP
jgi:hypothetical protein